MIAVADEIILMNPESRRIYLDRHAERATLRAGASLTGRWVNGAHRSDPSVCDAVAQRLLELEAELEQARKHRIALVAFVMDEHGCHGTPGASCPQWCTVLAGLPSEVLATAAAKRLADETERSR